MTDAEQQRLRDHQEISNLLARYARGLDAHDWDAVQACFEPGAAFVHPGGVQEGGEAIVERARAALTPLTASQHLLGTIAIEVDGDTAHASTYFQAQHVRDDAPGGPLFIIAGTYDDDLVRSADGWRIRERRQTYTWRDGNPEVVRRTPRPTA